MLSGGSWVQIPAGSTTRVFKQTGETDDRVIGGGGGKRTHTSVGNEYRKFPRWCCLRVGYSELINGLITAASGALAC